MYRRLFAPQSSFIVFPFLFATKPNSLVSAAAKNHPGTLHLSGNPEWQPRFIDLWPRANVRDHSWAVLPGGPWAQWARAQGLRSWSCTQDGGVCLHRLRQLQPHTLHPSPLIRTCKNNSRGSYTLGLSAQPLYTRLRVSGNRVPKHAASVPIPRGFREKWHEERREDRVVVCDQGEETKSDFCPIMR